MALSHVVLFALWFNV